MSSQLTKDPAKEKRDTLERFLNDEHTLVHVAPRADDVEVPENLRHSPTVTLKLSRYFRGKMEISATGVSAELLFGETYFTCKVPFAAVWGMTSVKGQFLMWPESTPPEVLSTLERQSEERRNEALSAEAETSGESIPAVATTDTGSRPRLRRVK